MAACTIGSGLSGLAQTTGTDPTTIRVVDTSGSALPGARVTITGPGLREEGITSGDGRFALPVFLQPPPASYTVTATLAGFEAASVTTRASEAGADAVITIRMRIGCLDGPPLVVSRELQETLEKADVVALVRLDSVERQQRGRFGDYCGPITTFAATIVEPIKDRRSQPVGTIRFVMQNHDSEFEQGSDYIAILQWQSGMRTYGVMSPYLLPVRNGWVESPAPGIVKSGPLAEVLSALRSITGQP
jgi:hypothetical protein